MSQVVTNKVSLPHGVRTSRWFPRAVAVTVLALSLLLLSKELPPLIAADRFVASVFDPILVTGSEHYGIWYRGSRIGTIQVTLKREERFRFQADITYGPESLGTLRAEFSDLRNLEHAELSLREGDRTLKLSLTGGRGELQTESSGRAESRQLSLPTPILLRQVAEGRYSLVSASRLQSRLPVEGVQFQREESHGDLLSFRSAEVSLKESLIDSVFERLRLFVVAQ